MSKIIIHNHSRLDDSMAAYLVSDVMRCGFVSGENQYCWLTNYPGQHVSIYARKTRGTTHSFDVRDSQ